MLIWSICISSWNNKCNDKNCSATGLCESCVDFYSMMLDVLLVVLFTNNLLIKVSNAQIQCPGCLDYYGSCRHPEENWIDDDTWQYHCTNNNSKFLGTSTVCVLIISAYPF